MQPSNVTSANYTQNVLRTGGDNYLVMDDINGAQTIEMSSGIDATSYVMGGPSELNLGVHHGIRTMPTRAKNAGSGTI
ncbi:MAG: hypothetical protein R3F14_02775 [Polyangiaceae bacterium]